MLSLPSAYQNVCLCIYVNVDSLFLQKKLNQDMPHIRTDQAIQGCVNNFSTCQVTVTLTSNSSDSPDVDRYIFLMQRLLNNWHKVQIWCPKGLWTTNRSMKKCQFCHKIKIIYTNIARKLNLIRFFESMQKWQYAPQVYQKDIDLK